jgi:IclR family transcriptional regulator, KDG regulon repressor
LLRVLEVFTAQDQDLALGDIAARVQLPKSSVHRLVATLLAHRFVEQDTPTRRYRLGIRLFELGSAAIHERGLQTAARPVLAHLGAQTGETCHLAVLSGIEAVYVDKIDGPSSIIMSSRVGRRAPSHATSIGKALVAWAEDDTLNQVRNHPMASFTSNTITTIEAWEAELATVRGQGYALDLEEFEEGLCCVAAQYANRVGA